MLKSMTTREIKQVPLGLPFGIEFEHEKYCTEVSKGDRAVLVEHRFTFMSHHVINTLNKAEGNECLTRVTARKMWNYFYGDIYATLNELEHKIKYKYGQQDVPEFDHIRKLLGKSL